MKKLLNAVFAALLITAPAFAQDASFSQMAQARAGVGRTIVDSKGAIVGTLTDGYVGLVERFVNNQWVQFPVRRPGFGFAVPAVTPFNHVTLFTSADCSGQAYMEAVALPVQTEFVGSGTPDSHGYFSSGTL